jgi:hypothetical protein
VESSTRTKEQQLAHERKQAEEAYKKQLGDEKKGREHAEAMLRDSISERELLDAATSVQSFNPMQVVTILRSMTRPEITRDPTTGRITGVKTVVDFPETGADGTEVKTPLTPKAAAQKMQALPGLYGNLFKSGVVSGLGSGSMPSGPSGKLDVKALSPSQYMDLRQKNPEALGLRRDKRRSF